MLEGRDSLNLAAGERFERSFNAPEAFGLPLADPAK